MSEIILICAAAQNGVIGKDGTIPWRLPADMKRFKAMTMGHTVVMGRKTWDTLPEKNRPLPGRHNIVVTRQPGWQREGAECEANIANALGREGTVFVIGGGEIYRAALPYVTRIEWTEVHGDFDGDAWFVFDHSQWRETARENHAGENGLGYSFVTLERVK